VAANPQIVDRARDAIRVWREHPEVFVREVFKVEPYLWQLDVLRDFPTNPGQALACCKGVGKTTVMAWLAWNFLVTRGPDCRAKALSITGRNLKDNLWAELAVWYAASPILRMAFEMTAERISQREHPQRWFMAAASFAQSASEQELGATLAGLWAPYVLILVDEAGEVPVPIVRVAEAVWQREGTEGHVMVAGNTTSRDGVLYDCVVKRRNRYHCYEVTGDPDDQKRCPVINLEYAREQLKLYGRDDPWVMINILAKFPATGLNHLVAEDIVRACVGRHIHQRAYDWAPKIFGGDVADFGDDATVGYPRQGLVALEPLVLRKMDPVQIAGHFGAYCQRWGAHSIQIDATGGYGAGPAAIMTDQGFTVMRVQFSAAALDPKFYNLRSEIIWKTAEWFKTEPSITDCPQLIEEVTAVQYSYKGDKILIEPKELLKARIGRSSDYLDALACTFAFPVAAPDDTRRALFEFDIASAIGKSRVEYDPLERP
jgi:phage terminase large subunit